MVDAFSDTGGDFQDNLHVLVFDRERCGRDDLIAALEKCPKIDHWIIGMPDVFFIRSALPPSALFSAIRACDPRLSFVVLQTAAMGGHVEPVAHDFVMEPLATYRDRWTRRAARHPHWFAQSGAARF